MATRQVCISSRIQPVSNVISKNQIYVNLCQPIVAPRGYDIYCSLVDAQIPNVMNNVNDNNATITFTAKYGTLRATVSLTLTQGNYTPATLVTLWGAAGRVLNFTLNGTACSANILLTQVNGIFTLKINGAPTGLPTGAGPTPSWSFDITNSLLGFVEQTFTTAGTRAACAPNLSPRYYLIASTLNTLNQFPAAGLDMPVKFIGRVPFTAAYSYTEVYTNPGLSPLKLADRVISNFTLMLLDDMARPVDLLGNDWACSLQFEFLPKIELRGDYWEGDGFYSHPPVDEL